MLPIHAQVANSLAATAGGARGGRPARGQVRSALIAERFVLLSETGMARFSVAELARRLGVSTAAPYRHFRNRDALLAAVAARAADELSQAMEAAGPDPVDQLAATAGAYVRHVSDRGAGLVATRATRGGRAAPRQPALIRKTPAEELPPGAVL